MIKENLKYSDYHVVIVGAGWAGLCLARQLKRAKPELRILQLEANTEFHAKIGEATVEITGNYFIKKLGLANYLYRNQLPKNALRFFYDNEEHSLPIEKMSEQGTTYIPPHPAFQLERASFEKDLVDMNREQGIDILLGAKVDDIKLNSTNKHKIDFQYRNEMIQVECKWVVDASGKRGVLTRKQKHHYKLNVPDHSAAWGRFSGVKDFDSVGDKQWRDKASARFLSTNHFTGEGYWIWFIPLKKGQTSVGVVFDNSRVEKKSFSQQEFISFLRSHQAIADLLEDASIDDYETWSKLAYRGKGIVSPDRWGATGFAAFFLDPLLSPGGDIIALSNDALTQIIIDDISSLDINEANRHLKRQVPRANAVLHTYFQYLYAQIMNLYPVLESAELCAPVMSYTNATYFITSSWDYLAGNFENYDYFEKTQHYRRGHFVLEKILQRQIIETAEIMRKQNRILRQNDAGRFETGNDLYKYYIYNMGEANRDGYRIDVRLKLFCFTFAKITGSKLNLKNFAQRKLIQDNFNLSLILNNPCFGEDELDEFLSIVSQQLTESVQQVTEHTVITRVGREAFDNDSVELAVVGGTADQAEIDKLQRKANILWQTKQEYIEQDSAAAIFLKFCRSLSEDVFSEEYPVRLTLNEMEN